MAPSSSTLSGAHGKKVDKGKGRDMRGGGNNAAGGADATMYGATESPASPSSHCQEDDESRVGEEADRRRHATVARDERTPLIKAAAHRRAATCKSDSSSSSATTAGPRRRAWWTRRYLLTLLIALTGTLLVATVLGLALLVGSFMPDEQEVERWMDLSNMGSGAAGGVLRWPSQGPVDRVEIVNVTDAGVATALVKLHSDDDDDGQQRREGSIWVRVQGRVAIDTDVLLGIRRRQQRWPLLASSRGGLDDDDDDDEARRLPERGLGARWWERLRARVADSVLRMLIRSGANEVVVDVPREVEVEFWHSPGRALADSKPRQRRRRPHDEDDDDKAHARRFRPSLAARLAGPLRIPLDPPPAAPSLSPSPSQYHTIMALVELRPPTIASAEDASELLAFARRVLEEGQVGMQVRTGKVAVRLSEAGRRSSPSQGATGATTKSSATSSSPWWMKWARGAVKDVRLDAVMQLPDLPDVSHNRSISDLVHVRDYSIRTTGNRSAPTIMLSARATALNPLFANSSSPSAMPFDFHLDWPYDLPFEVLLPDGDRHSTLARVVTRPVSLDARHQSSLAVRIDGEVDRQLGGASEEAMSRFLQNYLHGKDNEVIVRGLATMPSTLCNASSAASRTPSWILRALPAINATVSFPSPPEDELDLIRSVTIENMRISQADGRFMASGVVKAVVELPKEMRGLHVDVTAALPDILVFNGALADKREIDPDHEPFPAKAFGHIHPPKWLDATSETQGDLILLTAPIENQPLDVIPGRDSELSDFVTKIIFRGSALAGIKGKAGVKIRLAGVDSEIAVQGLPVAGEVVVGRPKI